MQIKIFTIPILDGESINEEMNVFLRSKKVLQVESQLLNTDGGAFWCFCVKYLEENTGGKRRKVAYKAVLDEASFRRFNQLRKIRKELAQEEGIPAFAVCTDEELAGLAKLTDLTPSSMKSVRGIGDKKVEKYGQKIITKLTDETSK